MFSFFISLVISVSHAGLSESALQKRFAKPSVHNGPNCYNTSLIALGYMDDVVHVSPLEAQFYIGHFCKEVSKDPAQAQFGDILVYRDNQGLSHMSYALGNARVFEKYNLLGSHGSATRAPIQDGFHGDYLFHKQSESVFNTAQPSVYRCADAATVRPLMSKLNTKAWAQGVAESSGRARV